jgi:hypothetical protein
MFAWRAPNGTMYKREAPYTKGCSRISVPSSELMEVLTEEPMLEELVLKGMDLMKASRAADAAGTPLTEDQIKEMLA